MTRQESNLNEAQLRQRQRDLEAMGYRRAPDNTSERQLAPKQYAVREGIGTPTSFDGPRVYSIVWFE